MFIVMFLPSLYCEAITKLFIELYVNNNINGSSIMFLYKNILDIHIEETCLYYAFG